MRFNFIASKSGNNILFRDHEKECSPELNLAHFNAGHWVCDADPEVPDEVALAMFNLLRHDASIKLEADASVLVERIRALFESAEDAVKSHRRKIGLIVAQWPQWKRCVRVSPCSPTNEEG